MKAGHRYLLYDHACQARKGAELRFPHRVRNWALLVDRKHWVNHTTCSQSFNIDEYPQLKNVNSQISEQLNRSLRKLHSVVAYLRSAIFLVSKMGTLAKVSVFRPQKMALPLRVFWQNDFPLRGTPLTDKIC